MRLPFMAKPSILRRAPLFLITCAVGSVYLACLPDSKSQDRPAVATTQANQAAGAGVNATSQPAAAATPQPNVAATVAASASGTPNAPSAATSPSPSLPQVTPTLTASVEPKATAQAPSAALPDLGIRYTKADPCLILRQEPNQTSLDLDCAPFGSQLKLHGSGQGWAHVTFNSKTGYMSATFMTTAPPTRAQAVNPGDQNSPQENSAP